MKRRILAIIMTLSMLLSLFPVALATETAGETGQLTHRGLDSDGERWWVRNEDLNQSIGQASPGSEHWLIFYAGDTGEPVEITENSEYVTLERISDSDPYYHITIARDCWGQEITLSSADGAYTDTFIIDRDHAAFFADDDPDLENYSDYRYNFALSRENSALYLHITPPKWAEGYEIRTEWYNPDTKEWEPHSGWEAAWIEETGIDDLFQITFDPLYAAQYYREEDFDLNLDIVYQGQDEENGNFEEAWGAGIHVNNDVNVLTHKGLDNDGESWGPRDEDLNWGIGRVAPGSEHWLVFYTGYTEEAVEVTVTQGSDYVTLKRIVNQEEPYYYIKVKEGYWDKTVTLSATVGSEVYTDTFVLDRNHADFFSEPGSDLNKHLNYFQLSDTNTTLYLHIDPPDWADSYEVRTKWYDENTEESGLLEGCDVVEIQDVDGQKDVFAITFDTQAVTRNYGHNDFGLNLDVCYQEVMEDGEIHEEVWGTGIHIANQIPYLQYLWLEEEGKGWFVRDENDWNENDWSYDFSIRPGDVFYHVYFLTYFEDGEPVTTPVIPTPQDGRLIVEELTDLEEEPIKEDQEYADYFVKVFSEENKWDEEESLSAAVNGHTASMTVPICRGQAEFYESTVPGNDTVLMEVDKEKNSVFYLGFQREPGWHVEEVYVMDDSLATLTDLGTDASGKYFLFQVTLTEKGIRIAEDFHLDVEYQWVNDEDENDRHHNGCGIYIPAVWPQDIQATFKIDSHEFYFVKADEAGNTHPYLWEWDETLGCPVLTLKGEDFPIHYNYLTNTITLTLEETGDILECLELIYEDHEGNQLLPSQDVTLALTGKNIIWNGSHPDVDNPDRVNYGPALRLEGGINLTITGEEGSSLVVHSENDDYDPWTHAAIDLWNNLGGSITFAGDAQYTVTVGGGGYEPDGENCFFNEETGEWHSVYLEDENGDQIPANLHAFGVETEEGTEHALFIRDNAVLNVLPGDAGPMWHGIQGFQTLEVLDNAVVNTGRLKMSYSEDAKLRVRNNAQLNVTPTSQLEENYLGIMIHTGSFALCDNGTVNITAPEMELENGQVFGFYILDGSFEVRSGNLNIDLTPMTTQDMDSAGGIGLFLGDSESDRGLTVSQTGGSVNIESGLGITAMDVEANATANLSGGTIAIQAWQGIVNNGIFNLRNGAAVTLEPWTLNGEVQQTWDGGLFCNDVHYIWRQVSALNVYGGELKITSFANPALVSATEFIQTGGTVTLDDRARGGEQEDILAPAVYFGGRTILSGGRMNVYGITGILIFPEASMMQNYFRLTGTDLTVYCDINGVMVSGDQDRIASMNLMGGKLTIHQAKPAAGLDNSAFVLDGGGLTVSGGKHTVNGYTEQAEGNSNGFRAYQSPGVKITGGSLTVAGHRAVVAESVEGSGNPISLGAGMYVHSNNDQAAGLTFVESDPQDEDEIFQGLTRYTLRETIDGQQVDSTSVTFEAGEAPVIPATAQMEVTTARATVGAMVTVQANVTAEKGTVTFELPPGLDFIPGSITVNNVGYDDDLTAIPVEGSAHIVFRVEPASEGDFTIDCTVTDGDSTAEAQTDFIVYGFRINAPSHTTTPNITVKGSAVPGDTIALTVTNKTTKAKKEVETQVTALGTFSIPVKLPLADNELSQVREFTLTMDKMDDLMVVYTPNYPYVNDMSIGNQIMDENDYPIWSDNYVSFENGTGTPQRNFYTYIPGLNIFRFVVNFQVPDGWAIENPRVELTYQDGMEIKTLEISMEKTSDGSGQEQYTYENDPGLPAPPSEFRIGYEVVPPYVDPDTGMTVSVYTNTVVVYPIIDPSGTIYCGSLDNPVAGATVTLYYGGDGEKASDEPQIFDMTPYDQVNPQLTDASGHYAWDVPTGWWQVVAEKNGVTTKSDWVRVLPAHTDLHIDLDLPITFDLQSIRIPGGEIPEGDFQAEVTVMNNGAKADVLLMVATYAENGQFLSFQPKPITGLKTGRTTTVQVDVSNPDGKAKSMKAFLVDGMNAMKPLSAAVEFPSK